MKLATFCVQQKELVGLVTGDEKQLIPLDALGCPFATMQQLIEETTPTQLDAINRAAAHYDGPMAAISEVRLLSPIPILRRDNICIGFNFKSHAQEITRQRGESTTQATIADPIYFTKRVLAATGDGDAIPYIPGLADKLDCGVEVAVVIGRDMLHVPQSKVMDYVFGYMIANDVCDTRLNKIYTQPFLGKSVDGYMPFGPWITTADEFPQDAIFHLKLAVNGDVVQDSTTDNLVFSIRYILSELCQDMTLKAGTVISTGSPANSERWQNSGRGYRPGDVITCTIDGLGTLTNTVTEIAAPHGGF